MPRTKKDATSYINRLEQEVENNQSKLSLILGILIVIVAGILFFNYFQDQKNKGDVGPAQTTQQQPDVAPNQLPGKYTVKVGDTLFTIAEKYYQDGSKFTAIAQNNNLASADQIEAGQVLEIPKLDAVTDFGPTITGNTYTVQEGDWLSTIAARAYNGDIMAYQNLAQVNNISNPDLILPGQVINIPR
ncbi:MAG: LysM peptidoglycan-binding domain-containing protein [Candidatus Daviesbacteria bacterium]|nr:MAG: LysM peptidoglycan-binding domain-containing protein [Candidatus Daviesbacteria bacterium]